MFPLKRILKRCFHSTSNHEKIETQRSWVTCPVTYLISGKVLLLEPIVFPWSCGVYLSATVLGFSHLTMYLDPFEGLLKPALLASTQVLHCVGMEWSLWFLHFSKLLPSLMRNISGVLICVAWEAVSGCEVLIFHHYHFFQVCISQIDSVGAGWQSMSQSSGW